MRPFRFCPRCGAGLEKSDDAELRCVECHHVWYRNPAPTVGAAIVHDGRALVTQRARDPEKGRFDVPGGFLDVDEDPIDGLKREIREELGVEIEAAVEDCISMVPHSYGADGVDVLALGFRARLVSGDPKPADDVAAFKWVTKDELDDLDFAWPHDRELIRRALEDATG